MSIKKVISIEIIIYEDGTVFSQYPKDIEVTVGELALTISELGFVKNRFQRIYDEHKRQEKEPTTIEKIKEKIKKKKIAADVDNEWKKK